MLTFSTFNCALYAVEGESNGVYCISVLFQRHIAPTYPHFVLICSTVVLPHWCLCTLTPSLKAQNGFRRIQLQIEPCHTSKSFSIVS